MHYARFLPAATLAVGVAFSASPLSAALINTVVNATPGGATVDQVLGADEYGPGNSYVFTGSGAGFGGTLGNGALYMKADATNLYIGFMPGGNLNDLVTIHLDTRAGGFTDAQMNDTSDGGRAAVSNLARDADDVFEILPDFGYVIGSFGMVLFETVDTATSFENKLIFQQFSDAATGNEADKFREFAIPLATLGNPTQVDFVVSYVSDSGYLSNESMPAQSFNASDNPGFGSGTLSHANYNRFVVVPEPSMLGLLGIAAVGAMRRRRV